MSGSIGGINKQEVFLAAYATCANLSAAAKSAGISRDLHYQWMREDPLYVEKFRQAVRGAAQTLEDEAVRRAVQGVTKDVIYQGERCYETTLDPVTGEKRYERLVTKEYSDMLLVKVLAKFNPEYREKSAVELTGADGGPVDTALTVTFVKPDGE